MKHRKFNEVKPYSYFIRRKSDGMKYVGVRYKNVSLNLTPEEDFGKVYFTSGRLRKDFKNNPDNYEVKLKYTFDDIDSMFEWEKRVVLRIVKYRDWSNQGWGKNYGENPEIGKLISEGKNRVKPCGRTSIEIGVEKLKDFIWNTEEGLKHREDISKRIKKFRKDMTPERQKEIQAKRAESMDFYAASRKASETMRNDIDSEGLNMLQRKSRKAMKTFAENNDMSAVGKKRNEDFARRLGEMSQKEFEEFCLGYSDRMAKSFATRRRKYLEAQTD